MALIHTRRNTGIKKKTKNKKQKKNKTKRIRKTTKNDTDAIKEKKKRLLHYTRRILMKKGVDFIPSL